MTALSRRSLLTAAAVVPVAAATPALAEQDCSFPDLAKRFEVIYARWLDRSLRDLDWSKRYKAAVEAKVGPRDEWAKGWRQDMPEEERMARHALLNTIEVPREDDPLDENGASLEWNRLGDELMDVVHEMLEQPTRSLVDLKWQLRAFALGESDLWTSGETDAQVFHARAIVDIACKFLGIGSALPGADRPIGAYA